MDVIPQGNRNVPTQKVMAVLKTRPGGEYKRELIEEDVRALYKTGSFADVRVVEERSGKGVVVYFQFRELTTLVQEILYQGAKHLKPDELDGVTGLHKGVPLNPVANRIAREAILRRYNEDGRALASVDLVEGDKPGDSRVIFRITEGPVCRVAAIDVTGNTFVSQSRLKTQINSSATFLHLPIGGKYNPLMLEDDVNKLLEYYRGFGFHDVTVAREVQWVGPAAVRLSFHVHEGPRYRVAGVDVSGVRSMKREEALMLARLRPDQIYNQADVDLDKARIKAALGYRGHDANVHEKLIFGPSGQVSVRYDVEE